MIPASASAGSVSTYASDHRTWKRHFRRPFLRWDSFGVSFSRNVPCRTTPSAFFELAARR
jgi:hypothetical protein